MLDGFRKSEVAAKLADVYAVCLFVLFLYIYNFFSSEFGHAVASEYLKFFDFEHLELDECLRQFLVSFTLSGETQERERVMVHFSDRYFECNQFTYASKGNNYACICARMFLLLDIVHGITCALLLLNSDLHTDVCYCITFTLHCSPSFLAWRAKNDFQSVCSQLTANRCKAP